MRRTIHLRVVVHNDADVRSRITRNVSISPKPPDGKETVSTRLAADLVDCVDQVVSKNGNEASNAG